MTAATINVTQDGHVRTITLNRPEQLNAMSTQLVNELAKALRDGAADDATRCVVITGAGRAFCAGGDISEFREAGAHEAFAPAVDLTAPMSGSGKIFIAAINGAAAGGAIGLMMGADFRLAKAGATFSSGFMPLGLAPDLGATLLERATGYSRALEFALLGSKISAQEALDIGLVNRVLADDRFDAEVEAFARAVAALPPLAVARTKRLLQMSGAKSAIEVLWAEAEAAEFLLSTEDHQEGIRAFMERRQPVFRGR